MMRIPRYEERPDIDACATLSDRMAAAGHAARLEDFQTAVGGDREMLTTPGHWLIHDDKDGDFELFCLGCAQREVAKRDDEDRWLPYGCGRGWIVDGGYDCEMRPRACDACGRTIDYQYDDSSAEQEIEHFVGTADATIDEPTDVQSICELIDWAKDFGPSMLEVLKGLDAITLRVDLEGYRRRLAQNLKELSDQTAADAADEAIRQARRDQLHDDLRGRERAA